MNEFTELVDLAAARLGGTVVAANDEFFAPRENLLVESAPVFIERRSAANWIVLSIACAGW